MKIKSGLLSHKVGEQYVIVASGEAGEVFNGMLRGNATTMEILKLLEQETTQNQIVEQLYARYDVPREKLEADVCQVIEKLKTAGLLDG